LLKNLRGFAPLRETFFSGLSRLGIINI